MCPIWKRLIFLELLFPIPTVFQVDFQWRCSPPFLHHRQAHCVAVEWPHGLGQTRSGRGGRRTGGDGHGMSWVYGGCIGDMHGIYGTYIYIYICNYIMGLYIYIYIHNGGYIYI